MPQEASSFFDLKSIDGELRKLFYDRTLDAGILGSRLCRVSELSALMEDSGKLIAERERNVAQFIRDYEDLKAKARVVLGPLFREEDYPPRDMLRDKFHAKLLVFPLPAPKDLQVRELESQLADMQESAHNALQGAVKNALQDAWGRVFEVVDKMASKLADKDGIFKDTLVSNVMDAAKSMPGWNLDDNAEMARIAEEIRNKLGAVNPNVLRSNVQVRAVKAAEARDLAKRLGQYAGLA
jgi:hypothetical protein